MNPIIPINSEKPAYGARSPSGQRLQAGDRNFIRTRSNNGRPMRSPSDKNDPRKSLDRS